MSIGRLNYHHLRYFWTIAREKSLTKAALKLHVSQSALSVQLRQLEERLGHALFERGHRRLSLTEAGRLTFEHAEAIFRTGDELVDALAGRATGRRQRVRIGAVATLSRNFQLALLAPLLDREDIAWTLRTGTLRELMAQLEAHALDVVLANVAVTEEGAHKVHSHLIARQPVSVVGKKTRDGKTLRFPEDLDGARMILPGRGSELRTAFDAQIERANIRIDVVAEVDDMALLRLLARESGVLSLVPPVVVKDELASGRLVERCRIPRLKENFYAITLHRRFPNPLIKSLVAAAAPLGK